METTKAERIRLGIFVLIMSFLILGTVAFLIGKKITEKYTPYKTRFTESVDGLNPGAKVKLNGIVVGQVISLEVDPEDLTAVIANFEVSSETPVKTTMTANLIGGISLTGLKSIELSGGTPNDPNAHKGDFIQSSVSGFKQITGQAEHIAEKIEGILNNLLNITSDYNQRHLYNVFTNLDNITARVDSVLKRNSNELNEIPRQAKLLLENSNETAIELKNLESKAVFTIARLDSLIIHADKKIQNMQIETVMKSANDAAKAAELFAKRGDQLIYRNQEDLAITVRNLREAVDNLRDVSRQVRENPSLLIRNEEKQQRVR
ncbi:MAG: MlaD family protein [Candidatus Fibromonas sp.]|jgi:phospholipid/cholesterol/gamma-HCH transport system substrate-binding protein|nr:MlaD family protein [Candidatus Fibromonas sp.]